jgi:hypothetical protein
MFTPPIRSKLYARTEQANPSGSAGSGSAGVESLNGKTHRRYSSDVVSRDGSKKADSYSPETYVIGLAELRQIIWEMQEDAASSEIKK